MAALPGLASKQTVPEPLCPYEQRRYAKVHVFINMADKKGKKLYLQTFLSFNLEHLYFTFSSKMFVFVGNWKYFAYILLYYAIQY
jgi:hypothetical protein